MLPCFGSSSYSCQHGRKYTIKKVGKKNKIKIENTKKNTGKKHGQTWKTRKVQGLLNGLGRYSVATQVPNK